MSNFNKITNDYINNIANRITNFSIYIFLLRADLLFLEYAFLLGVLISLNSGVFLF